ncbi:hypothetical protein [Virgibacillus ainsalahensis]
MSIPTKVKLNRIWMKRLMNKLNAMETLDIQQTHQLLLLREDLIRKGDPYIADCRHRLNTWREMFNTNKLNHYRYAWTFHTFLRIALYIFVGCFLLGMVLSLIETDRILSTIGPLKVFATLIAAFSWSTILMTLLGIYNFCRIRYNQRLIRQTKVKQQKDFIKQMRNTMDEIQQKLVEDSIVPRDLLTISAVKQMTTVMEWESFKGKKTQIEIIKWYLRKEEKKEARVAGKTSMQK